MRRPADPEEEVALLPISTYRARILSSVERLAAVSFATLDALGCVLDADVISPADLPPFESSAMDGFAVRSADIAGASEDRAVELEITGEVRMGRSTLLSVGTGQAVVMPTGGVVPLGADAVVPIELCEVRGGRVFVMRALEAGKHTRPAGEDVRRGDVLVAAGRRLSAIDLGALATAGIDAVDVVPPARVGVLSTGDELVPPGADLGDGQIYDSNAVTLAALVTEAGAEAVPGGAVPDDPDQLVAALDELAPHVDAFVCSGGVSMGERDPVKRAFTDLGSDGGDIGFEQVAMQPGRPQAFGVWRSRPFFGLPGNPVSVFVSFEVFVRPALMRMMGRTDQRASVDAVLRGDLHAPTTRTRFARVRIEQDDEGAVAIPVGGHQSNLFVSFSRADGLVEVPANTTIGDGEHVTVTLIR